MENLTINPSIKSLVPPLLPHELEQLESNIVAEGCRDPLVIWGSRRVVLDGHNRLEICRRHGIEFKTTTIEPVDDSAAKVWVVKNQFGRRNLTPYQRAELALQLESLFDEEARRSQGTRTDLLQNSVKSEENRNEPLFPQAVHSTPKQNKAAAPIRTDEELGRVAGVSRDTIQKARKIAEKAPEPLKEQLRKGETSINAAHKEIHAAEKAEKKGTYIFNSRMEK